MRSFVDAQDLMDSQSMRRRGRVPQRITWAQFKASRLPAVKAKIERCWELLVADDEARNLLTMRQRLGQSMDPGLVRLREEADKLIAERVRVLEDAGGAATATRQGQSTAWTPKTRPGSALLHRLGLDSAGLSSAFSLFSALLLQKDASDDEVLALLKDWCRLAPLQRRALWSIVFQLAYEQDRKIDSALGLVQQIPCSGFGLFLSEGGRCDPSEVEMQLVFFQLPEEELSGWLKDEARPWQLQLDLRVEKS